MRSLVVALFCALHLPAMALDLSDPAAAEIELEEFVAEWAEVVESDPNEEATTSLGSGLQALGIVERQLGKADEAVKHLEQACSLIKDEAQLADAHEALALTYQDLGKRTEAEDLLRTVLDYRSQQDHEKELHALTLDHLALNLLQQGRYSEVEALLKEALATLPDEQVGHQARILSHRGRLFHTLGSHARAIEDFEAAMKIATTDPTLTLALRSQRALAMLRLGRADEASMETEAVAKDARDIFKDTPLKIIPYINNRGALALTLGEPSAAEAAFKEALTLTEDHLGSDHPSIITGLNNLGVAQQQLNKLDDARLNFERALELQRKTSGDHPHLRTAETLRNLARNAQLADSADKLELTDAATHAGLALLDSLVEQGSEKERLNFLERFDLVSLPCATGDPERIAEVLLASKGRLLDAMLGSDAKLATPDWKAVAASLPKDSAFIDACRYQPLDGEKGPHYGAIVILPGKSPQWVDLGSEKDLLDWLSSLRERLAWQASVISGHSEGSKPSLTSKIILKGLERQFWSPISECLPKDTTDIAFAPDGGLHFLPLAALLDSKGTPLCHRFRQIVSVSSGRALLTDAPSNSLADKPWTIVTVSKFESAESSDPTNPLQQLLGELGEMPGTKQEAKRLKKIAPKGSVFLTDRKANEDALRSLSRAPGVLHLGCHAFFTGPDRSSSDLPLDFDESASLLHSSGLVLYQGARWDLGLPSSRDDLLFPTEIADLNLNGTRLVTLSSCDSGIGTPVAGEGLLGLRRAFALAGARDIMVALWPVSDQSTPEFMDRFYRLALNSNRSGQALWQAQAEHIPTADDPNFEASVLSFAPFNLSQNGPLITGGSIQADPPSKMPPLGTVALAIGLFFVVRWTLKWLQKRRAKP